MSLRSYFRAAELDELRRRLDRLDPARPERWLDPFPELRAEPPPDWNSPDRVAVLFASLHAEPGAWSYLCASLLRRELEGDEPTNPDWRAQRWLLGAPAVAALAPGITPADLPADWRPCVIEDNTRVTVIVHTALREQLLQHEDHYPSDGFEFERRVRLLGRLAAR